MTKNKRAGFTLIEMVTALAFTAMLFITALYFPVQLVRQYKEFESKVSYTENIVNVFKAFSNDISKEGGKFTSQENDLVLGKIKYNFSEKGLYRNNTSNLRLTKFPVSYILDLDYVTIDIPNEMGKNTIFIFPVNFSSFSNGGK